MKLEIENYPGSKKSSGFREMVINHTPEIDVYIELFTGSGALGRFFIEEMKKKEFLFIEKSTEVYNQLVDVIEPAPNVHLLNGDGVKILKAILFAYRNRRVMVYADPPYLKSTRRGQIDIYHFEWTREQHIEFLNQILKTKDDCFYVISHYECDLYNEMLEGWFKSAIQVMTRKGKAIETIYMNYDISQMRLETTAYLGKGFTDRQRIQRKVENLVAKLKRSPKHERQALTDAVLKVICENGWGELQ